MNQPALKFGVVGMGGYARVVTDELIRKAGQLVELKAVCDPQTETHSARAASLAAAGIHVSANIDELLKQPIDAVWLPVPIDLHKPFTEKALAAGKAVIVEKPAAGCLDEVDAMIAARDRAKLPVAVGFQNLFDPATWAAKRKLVGGAIGKPRRASVIACWPRGDMYYHRSPWAGKMRHNGVWVLDSPANNAMAHFVNLALFLLGRSERESAVPETVQAELYRANPIENYDTCTIRLQLPGGVELLIALTHACTNTIHPSITIDGDGGTMHFAHDDNYQFQPKAGPGESIHSGSNLISYVVDGFTAYVRGDTSVEYASLENARAHAFAISGASQASTVQNVAPDCIQTRPSEGGAPLRFIPGIEAAMEACAQRGCLISELGGIQWAVAAKVQSLVGFHHLSPGDAI